MISPPPTKKRMQKKKRSFSSVSAKPAKAAPNRKVLMVCSVSVAQGEAVQITASLTGWDLDPPKGGRPITPWRFFWEKSRKKNPLNLSEKKNSMDNTWMDPFLGGDCTKEHTKNVRVEVYSGKKNNKHVFCKRTPKHEI